MWIQVSFKNRNWFRKKKSQNSKIPDCTIKLDRFRNRYFFPEVFYINNILLEKKLKKSRIQKKKYKKKIKKAEF